MTGPSANPIMPLTNSNVANELTIPDNNVAIENRNTKMTSIGFFFPKKSERLAKIKVASPKNTPVTDTVIPNWVLDSPKSGAILGKINPKLKRSKNTRPTTRNIIMTRKFSYGRFSIKLPPSKIYPYTQKVETYPKLYTLNYRVFTSVKKGSFIFASVS